MCFIEVNIFFGQLYRSNSWPFPISHAITLFLIILTTILWIMKFVVQKSRPGGTKTVIFAKLRLEVTARVQHFDLIEDIVYQITSTILPTFMKIKHPALLQLYIWKCDDFDFFQMTSVTSIGQLWCHSCMITTFLLEVGFFEFLTFWSFSGYI